MNTTNSGLLGYEVAISDEDYWESIEFALSEIHDLLNMRFETMVEAIGEQVSPPDPDTHKKAKWEGAAPIGKGWRLIPYVNALDQIDVHERFQIVASLLTSVEQRASARELSPRFLHEWGLLNWYAGAIDLILHSETDVGRLRTALAGGKAKSDASEVYKRWFAHYFLRIYERGQREKAEKAVERLINAIIDGNIDLPPGYAVEWFEDFLVLDVPPDDNRYATLKPAFDQHSLSVSSMKELQAKGAEGIPSVDLEFPDP